MTLADTLKVEVVELRPSLRPGNVRGYATVRIGPLVVHGFKVVQQPAQRPWVSVPQTERDGRYWPIVEFQDRNLLARAREAVLDAWQGQPRFDFR